MAAPRGVVPPNLPVAPVQYESRYQDQFSNVLRLFFTRLTNYVNAPTAHASYFDTTTQTNPVANAVNLFTYNSVVSDYEVTRGNPTSKIYVTNTGVYNFQFSAQLDTRPIGVIARSVVFSSLPDGLCISGPMTGQPTSPESEGFFAKVKELWEDLRE